MSYFNEYVVLSVFMGVVMLYLMFMWLENSGDKAVNPNANKMLELDAHYADGAGEDEGMNEMAGAVVGGKSTHG